VRYVYPVVGTLGLDPTAHALSLVETAVAFDGTSPAADGFRANYDGLPLFMNPTFQEEQPEQYELPVPYRPLWAWLNRAASAVRRGESPAALTMFPAYLDRPWWHWLVGEGAVAWSLPKHRIQYDEPIEQNGKLVRARPEHQPRFHTMFALFAREAGYVEAFVESHRTAGATVTLRTTTGPRVAT
jgi:hypothetical protein